MADYQLTATPDMVIRTADGAHIPNDPGNRDWIEYQAWLDAGGVPDPYVPPPVPPPLPRLALAWSDQYKALAGSQTGAAAIGLIAWDRNNPVSAFHVYIAKVNVANTDITSIFLPAMTVGAILRFEDRRNPSTRYVTHKIKTAPAIRTDDIAVEIAQDTATAMPFFDGQLLNFIVYPPA